MYFTNQNLKLALFAILKVWSCKFAWNLVKMSVFMRNYYFWKKILVLVCKIHIFGWSVKYTFQPLQISGTRSVFDLKFSPVIDIDHIKQFGKFQFGHLSGWYFTDRSVNYLYCAILSDLEIQSCWNFDQGFVLIRSTRVKNFKLITWLDGILQTRPECKKPRSVKYHQVTWPT